MSRSATQSTTPGRVAVSPAPPPAWGWASPGASPNKGRVALFDRQGDAARQAVTELSTVLGSATRAYEVDVTDRDAINGVVDRDAINDAVSAVRDEFGPVEILVASAGVDSFTPFTDITVQEWDHILGVRPHRHIPLRPGRRPGHAGSRLGPDRHHLIGQRAVRRDRHGALRRGEGRRHT
ncbi:SDR family NAD(P)-dependent oxidoreductase [Streptomyces sp. NPDC059892]|uniref:SDR family NAD(P)-dependent oxidoreductase n=1 Tax=Streptomyces sp. NPDC059892 TaxID=3346989 RepID=UPI00365C8DCE